MMVIISNNADVVHSPKFIESKSGNVTAILGKMATLSCRVSRIGNKTVSWIRHSDTHLLSAGR